ncbi:MAG: acyl-CoA dehydratase activase-related protein [Oscillospiraceae bacterium]|nr:acyl-CoA dehydratase activase-related protein [Oscillospiraceae bacterium]
MKIGLPRGLMYAKYHTFAKTFLEELGAEVVVSPPTNKKILDRGVRCCVDEACLPMKIFHGHVDWLKDRCDALLTPRLIGVRDKEYICPMFCGLIELISNNIPDLPPLIDAPVTSLEYGKLIKWAKQAGGFIQKDDTKIALAFDRARKAQQMEQIGYNEAGYPLKIALVGHVYNIYDQFINMNVKKKLNELGIGVMTYQQVDRGDIDAQIQTLFKKPFWTFAGEYYGASVYISKKGLADGILYLSSFSCGIDSVMTELIQSEIGDFPFMVLKLDEHTGEAGFDTRIEAFSDMLKRRCEFGRHLS